MKSNEVNSTLVAKSRWKVIVVPSKSGQLQPPQSQKQGDAYADGTLVANGSGADIGTQLGGLSASAGGVVSIYDINSSAGIAAAALIWTKTVAAGDIYTFPDTMMAHGVYVVTDATAQVVVCCV